MASRYTRNYGVDLLRICAMVMIIVLHIFGHGGVLSNYTTDDISFYISYYLEAISYCAVDCFVLLSGYVMCANRFRAKRIVELWFLVFFWSVTISAIGFIVYPETFSIGNIVKPFFPLLTGRYWFFNAYFVMILFSPILNLVIRRSSKCLYQRILFSCFVVFGLMPLFPLGEDVFGLGKGYEFPWFLVLYLLGGYLKRFEREIKWKKSGIYLLAVIILPLVNSLYYFVSLHVTLTFFGEARYTNLLLTYISPTVVVEAVALFALFKNLNLKNFYIKIVQIIQPSVFSVYLIHDHPFVREHWISNAFLALASVQPILSIVLIICSALCIFAICILLDRIRILIFQWLRINKLSDWISERIIKCMDHFFP